MAFAKARGSTGGDMDRVEGKFSEVVDSVSYKGRGQISFRSHANSGPFIGYTLLYR